MDEKDDRNELHSVEGYKFENFLVKTLVYYTVIKRVVCRDFFKLIDSSKFLFLCVNFSLSVVVYIAIGNKLSIEYLVSMSLAITGGVWSYLSIEISKVKEVRAEYIRRLEDVEHCVQELRAQAGVFFSHFEIISVYQDEELRDNLILLSRERNELAKLQNSLIYKINKMEKNKYNKKDFSEMLLTANLLTASLDNYFDRMNEGNITVGENDQESFMKTVNLLLFKMHEVFNDMDVGFEFFSEEYHFKSLICYSVVAVCLMTVFLKGFLDAF
ncbi:hypothetical protein K8090_11000 [Halomonas meridiana]|uniref:hypothetical protein n=1 Tax=Vreelandella aquamarina TaxID=77097 RepID=UPI001E5B4634|nr:MULTISPECIES: hypothetical protein [Halomonas]MCD1652121.1 hypothetical protein [Halomonas axialensis]MCD2088273.1 hypothetical protein [Halomonas meridiana]